MDATCYAKKRYAFLLGQQTPQEGDDLSTVAGHVGTEGVSGIALGDTGLDGPEDRVGVELAGGDILEGIGLGAGGSVLAAEEEGHDLAAGASLVGAEGGLRGALGDAVLDGPQDGVVAVAALGDVGEGHGGGLGSGLAGGAPQEGDDLAAGADLVGSEGGIGLALGDAVLDGPLHSVLIVGAGDHVGELLIGGGGLSGSHRAYGDVGLTGLGGLLRLSRTDRDGGLIGLRGANGGCGFGRLHWLGGFRGFCGNKVRIQLGNPGLNPADHVVDHVSIGGAACPEMVAHIGVPDSDEYAFSEGGEGAVDLANLVVETIENKPSEPLQFTYNDEDSVQQKIEKVATNLYGASVVTYSTLTRNKIKLIEEMGIGHYPVCIAKTQYSFSADPKVYGAVDNFELHIKDIVINNGAEMIVAIAGEIMRMPGLPKEPQALHIDIVDGNIEGLS